MCKLIPLAKCAARAKASCQVNTSARARVCVCVCVCVSAVFSPEETRLSAEQLQLLSACQSRQACRSVCLSEARECFFFFLFYFFFFFTLTRASPSVDPPHRMSLFRPAKILEIPSLAVNREILFSFSCNTSDVSESCSVMKV